MKIVYYGHSCFCVTTEKGTSVCTDPYRGVGYELPQGLRAQIVTVSHAHFDHDHTAALGQCAKILDRAGKYSFDGLEITAIESFHDPEGGRLRGKNLIFKIRSGGVCLCHLGDLGEACSEEIVQKIGSVDVLLIPIGGRYTIDSAQAKEYVERIKPRFVIPMHYRPKDGSLDIAEPSVFLSLLGAENIPSQSEVTIKKEDCDGAETTLIFMERKI